MKNSPKRDDFPKTVMEVLAKRVASRCSNPDCRHITSGPHTDNNKALNVGVAAHITAASKGGPRFDNSMDSDSRKSIENGVWLCQRCAKLVDNDQIRFTKELLLQWKAGAERMTLLEIRSAVNENGSSKVDPLDNSNTQKKREIDKRNLVKFYENVPRAMINEFLSEALSDSIIIHVIRWMPVATDFVRTITFRMYDEKLHLLILDFMENWDALYQISVTIFHHYGNGRATPMRHEIKAECFKPNYEKYHEICNVTASAYYELNRYVSDHYLDIDFKAIDQEGERKWSERKRRLG